MNVRAPVLITVLILLAGCGSPGSGAARLQQLQAASGVLRRTDRLSAAVAADTSHVDAGMAKDRAGYIRQQARRLVADARSLKSVDGRLLRLLDSAQTHLTGPARRYMRALLAAVRTQRRESLALVSVGRRIRSDPLLERGGSLRVLSTELRARRDATIVRSELRRAGLIRSAHPKAFTYVRRSNG